MWPVELQQFITFEAHFVIPCCRCFLAFRRKARGSVVHKKNVKKHNSGLKISLCKYKKLQCRTMRLHANKNVKSFEFMCLISARMRRANDVRHSVINYMSRQNMWFSSFGLLYCNLGFTLKNVCGGFFFVAPRQSHWSAALERFYTHTWKKQTNYFSCASQMHFAAFFLFASTVTLLLTNVCEYS